MELVMTNVIQLDPEKRAIEASLRPAGLEVAQAAVKALAKKLAVMPSIEDPQAFKKTMAEFLAPYPADVLLAAVNEAIARVERSPDGRVRVLGFDCMPSTRQMVEICERLIAPRRAELRALKWAEDYERRAAAERAAKQAKWEQLQAERERDAQAQRKRQEARIMWLQGVERRARERFGDAGPLPGDVELADSIVGWVRRGYESSWLNALNDGEEWAAKFCRLMALAARIRDAVLAGRARWDVGLALAKKLTTDEAEVRRLIDEIERRPGGTGEMLTESFWVELWRVHRACGCDVPADVVFPEDQAAALKRLDLSALAQERAVIDRQTEQEWAAKRAARRIVAAPPEPAQETAGPPEPGNEEQ
jgi:hypothetical protein